MAKVICCATTSPITFMSLIDTTKYRPVVYSEVPRVLDVYKKEIAKDPKRTRPVVCLVFGATFLPRIQDDMGSIATVAIFDDSVAIAAAAEALGAPIVDVQDSGGSVVPKLLTPQDLNNLLHTGAGAVYDSAKTSLLNTVKTVMTKGRKANVLETTGKMPKPIKIDGGNLQAAFSQLRGALDDDLFTATIDLYPKYLFRVIERGVVTPLTKRLPKEAKELWGSMLSFADSANGLALAKAYATLCGAVDPDFRAGHALAKFGVKQFSPDFVYAVNILPPSPSVVFIDDEVSAHKGNTEIRVITQATTGDGDSRVKTVRAKT